MQVKIDTSELAALARAGRDEIAGMRQSQIEFETPLVANAYHEAGLTDFDLNGEAVEAAQHGYPGMTRALLTQPGT